MRQHSLGLLLRLSIAAASLVSSNAYSQQYTWGDGNITSQWGTNCSILGGSYNEIMVQATTGYYGDHQNFTFPRVNDVYYAHVLVSIPGNPCPDGVTEVFTKIALPANTTMAYSAQYPVRCFYQGRSTNGAWAEVTNDPAASCPSAPTLGNDGYWNLNWRPLASGMMFDIWFPVRTSVYTPGTSQFTAKIDFADEYGSAYPSRSVWVAPATTAITIDHAPVANLTHSSAQTAATVWNRYNAGNFYFDFGPTTSYGLTIGPYAIPNTWEGATAYQHYVALQPGTTYNWRARFVPSSGAPVYGANQTFTTLPTYVPPFQGDFNGDGRNDIIMRNVDNGGIGMYLMNGPTATTTGYVGAASGYRIAGIGDFNADGKDDVLLRDGNGNLGIWLMNGITIAAGGFAGAAGGYQVAGVADFGGDGKADILLRDSNGNLGMWAMNGTTIASGAFVGAPGAYTVAGTDDFNGDGKADILLRDHLGNIGLWIMNGPNIVSGHFVGAPGAYSVAAVRDFDGDNRADIVLRDSNGNLGMWLMNAHVIKSGHFIGSAGWNLSVVSVGDYNGNGRPDILLSTPLGALGMWLMNGPAIVSGSSVTPSPGPDYEVH